MLQKRGKFMSAQNLTLLTDLYELTMMQGYYEKGQNENVKEKNQALYKCLILMNGFTDDITAIFSDTLFLVFIQFFRIDRFAIF